MEKVLMYDTLCGLVHRCMFAGLDIKGHAQWVTITPGEEAKTLKDVIEDEELGDTRHLVLCAEGEPAPSEQIAKVLGIVAQIPIDNLQKDLNNALRQMRQLGVTWEHKPLNVVVRVFENSDYSNRRGRYSFWVMDSENCCGIYADIDGFDNMEDLFEALQTFLKSIEDDADIPIVTKNLNISTTLWPLLEDEYIDMFDDVVQTEL